MDHNNKQSTIGLIFRGMAMGIAEVIPGVSGGTIAFITGIYQTLIDSIKSVDIALIKNLLFGKWNLAFAQINGRFLSFLFTGMALGVIVGIFSVTFLLENYPEPLWGGFFGLIIASGIYIAQQITNWNTKNIFLLFMAFIVSFAITLVIPANGSESLFLIFLSGCVAICALILPGISGSFILLLLGMYGIIMPNVKALLIDFNPNSFIIVSVFGLGCIVGLMGFSRILSHAFKNYKNATLAILTGLMLGSLNKIWPWRNPMKAYNKDSKSYFDVDLANIDNYNLEVVKWIKEANVIPSNYFNEPNTGITLICMTLGFLLVFLLQIINNSD